jgi:protein SCO1/2
MNTAAPFIRNTLGMLLGFFIIAGGLGNQLFSHGTQQHATNDSIAGDTDHAPAFSGTMGFEEKQGSVVPLNLPFITEAGDSVTLQELIKGPVVLCLQYYRCTDACALLTTSLAVVLSAYADNPNAAPRIITVSIDETETSADAMKAKNIVMQEIQWAYPADRWHFLTGSAASIAKLGDAVGFRFIKKGDDFDHPLGLIILSPHGKVVRYILGTGYLPLDISMSLMEASSGMVQPTVARILRACFSYDPKSQRMVFDILRVSATVIFTLVGSFILYLIVSGRRKSRKGVR